MGIGYLLGGIACIMYFFGVGIMGGVKKSPGVLKLAKMKINKNMTDEKAAILCLVMGIIIGLVGILLFVLGIIQN